MNKIKQLYLSIALLLFGVGVFGTPGTGAWFRDSESSSNNQLNASVLDATLTSPLPFSPTKIEAGEDAVKDFTVNNVGDLPFIYSLKSDNLAETGDLCGAFEVTLTKLGVVDQEIYQGPLGDLLVNSLGLNLSLSLLPGASHTLQVKFSLPTDASVSLIENQCDFDLKLTAWQTDFAPDLIGFWDTEQVTSSIRTGDWTPLVCSDITGYKRDDQGNGLADWQIVIHPESSPSAETVYMTANDMDGATSSAVLDENKIYMIDVENNPPADAYTLLMNGLDVTGKRGMVLSQQVGKLTFTIKDPNEANQGNYMIRIFDVTEQVVTTNSTGYYSKRFCDPGKYRVMEVPQNDWEQLTPANPFYVIEIPVSGEQYNFVNKKTQRKIVINEVYYDVDGDHGVETPISQSDEWVELYNPNDYPINLKKWTMSDNNEERPVSNRNVYIPAHGFAVIAKSAQTWTHWDLIPESAVLIELGLGWGNGLGNDGDRIVLRDSLGNTIDQVSWGTDTSAFTPSVSDVPEGHSIQRSPLGFDSDKARDWTDTSNPSPGTNPHSHIEVSIQQVEDKLQVSFDNAVGFDRVKYSLMYDRLNEFGEVTPEFIPAYEASKPVNQIEFELDPIYLGTCSETFGVVCTPHTAITHGFVSFMYYLEGSILGVSTLPFTWTDLP